ncbi:hypothetical protein G7Z17_g9651 [Cylindrodendrum hubeiense]|uniref:Uncharacterized protein n=1 Tax=Cylindrodendrum hubeiense TaxID=595255 RepID=A0A9P5L7Y0_9HYPO|nr:hypothetical protein G7Z17_g9651 [Cylindrodendrum hubeiense]
MTEGSYGSVFNKAEGGVYATWLEPDALKIYWWSRKDIPTDITTGKPDPSKWGKPASQFISGKDCNIGAYFKEQTIIARAALIQSSEYDISDSLIREFISTPTPAPGSIFLGDDAFIDISIPPSPAYPWAQSTSSDVFEHSKTSEPALATNLSAAAAGIALESKATLYDTMKVIRTFCAAIDQIVKQFPTGCINEGACWAPPLGADAVELATNWITGKREGSGKSARLFRQLHPELAVAAAESSPAPKALTLRPTEGTPTPSPNKRRRQASDSDLMGQRPSQQTTDMRPLRIIQGNIGKDSDSHDSGLSLTALLSQRISTPHIRSGEPEPMGTKGPGSLHNGRSAPWWIKDCAKAHTQYQAAKRRDPEELGPALLARDDFRKIVKNTKIDFWRDIINNATTNADIFRINGWVRMQSAFHPQPLRGVHMPIQNSDNIAKRLTAKLTHLNQISPGPTIALVPRRRV